jgi:phage/plasmid-like protein (TIGR03299 family)
MAHKIDQTTGKAAFISFQSPAWHGLGKTFMDHITVEDALRESGTNFQVVKLPNIHRLPSGIDVVSNDSFFTMRDDTNAVLGSRLGRDYTVYQNTEALSLVDDMLKFGNCKIETVGGVDDGKKVFICLKLNEGIKVGGSDRIEQYVLLANSHDGSLAITAMPTNIRVVCNNTLSAALGGAKPAHKIRHTTNADIRVKEAFTIMGLLEDTKKANEAAYNAMKCNIIDKSEFFDYIGNIFMTGEEIKELQAGNRDALSTRKKNTVAEVLQFAEAGIGQREALGNDGLNMWYAYNAVTGYLTSKKYGSVDDRFNSLMLGDSASKIKTAGELATHTHNIKPLKATSQGSNLMLN